jgi:hypothetical protein
MRRLISLIVFSTASCVVAAASAFWEYGRRLVRALSFAGQTIKKRYGYA